MTSLNRLYSGNDLRLEDRTLGQEQVMLHCYISLLISLNAIL